VQGKEAILQGKGKTISVTSRSEQAMGAMALLGCKQGQRPYQIDARFPWQQLSLIGWDVERLLLHQQKETADA
jgi:hypothetical protein